ncbi:MAG: hypothetical protein ACO3I1_05170 [Burkholderiales bacterium]
MESINPSEHLNRYVTERLPQLVPGIFSGAPDLPDFTVDQRFEALQAPTYGV